MNSNEGTILSIEKTASRLLIGMLTGHWGKFERIRKTKNIKISSKLRLLETMKDILVALLPSVALLLIQKFQFVDLAIINYLLVITIIWALINLLKLIDPSFIEKIKTTKEMADIIKPK